MSRWHPRNWIEWIPEDFDDATSFRHMRMFAIKELQHNAAIRKEIVNQCGEQTAIDEWDSVFESDNRSCREAIEMIEERMRKLGIDERHFGY